MSAEDMTVELKRYWVLSEVRPGVLSMHDTEEEAVLAARALDEPTLIQDFNSLSPGTFKEKGGPKQVSTTDATKKDFGWGIGNPMPGKKTEETVPMSKIFLFRDIFEASGKPYPAAINCPGCKGENKAECKAGPYGYLAQVPGYLTYQCNRCGAMIHIDPNTCFLSHPGTFMASLDMLKANFSKPVAENWVEKKKHEESLEDD